MSKNECITKGKTSCFVEENKWADPSPLKEIWDQDYVERNEIEEQKFQKTEEIKKSSYVIALITIDNFIKRGAKLIDSGVYFIYKEYDGTPEKETCALLGIPIRNIYDFLIDDCELIKNIRKDPNLQYIEMIDKLTCRYIQNAISKFRLYLKSDMDEDVLVLLNIEPKASGKMERQYPVPRITIPGGTMEDKDFQDFERCALREFKEETGIDISMCHEKVSREKIKKGFRFNHFTKYKKNKLKSFYHRNKYEFDTKYISMYYLVKID